MYDMITIAITETKPLTGEFNVLALDINTQNNYEFKLEKDRIITPQGEILWDIGFITRVQEVETMQYNRNNISAPSGFELLSNKLPELKKLLDNYALGTKKFYDNSRVSFGVQKVSCVKQIFMHEGKHYITFEGEDGIKRRLLNKDYRWINYWDWAIKNDLYEEKAEKFLKFYNSGGKKLYLILKRYYFNNGPKCWISGMHWL